MVDPNRVLSPDETEAALGLLRAGRKAILSWGPCGRSYAWQLDHFVCEEWEEGDRSAVPIDEGEVRRAVREHPGAFRRVLHEPVREEFRRAFLADDRVRARELLAHEALATDPHVAMLAAFLAWPEVSPPADLCARIAGRLGRDGADAFRAAVGFPAFDRDRVATCRRGVAFLDTLDELAGGGGAHRFARAEWLRDAGDLHAALSDYRRVLADPAWPAAHEVRCAAGRAADLLQRLQLAPGDPAWFDVAAVQRAARRGSS